jgi:hypothetical protein
VLETTDGHCEGKAALLLGSTKLEKPTNDIVAA